MEADLEERRKIGTEKKWRKRKKGIVKRQWRRVRERKREGRSRESLVAEMDNNN